MGRYKLTPAENIIRNQPYYDLYMNGLKMKDIASRFNMTRQNISLKIRKYYKIMGLLNKTSVTRARCKICGLYYEFNYNKRELNKKERIIRTIKIKSKFHYVCDMCKKSDVYKCTNCSKTGELSLFSKSNYNRIFKTHLGLCLMCASERHLKWINKNEVNKNKHLLRCEKWRKSDKGRMWFNNHIKKIRIRQKADGICYYCGKNKAEVNRAYCPDCLEKNKIRYKKRTKVYKINGLCVRCGKTSRPDKYTCQNCEDKRKIK